MRVISIDMGLNNFLAITNNIGKRPNLIRGKSLKAENQWYNKMTEPLKKRLAITNDTEEYVKIKGELNYRAKQAVKHILEFFWRVSDWIIDYCVENRIDTVLIGRYKILERTDYVSIPFSQFISLLETKCRYHSIKFVVVPERYTSGTSFFDNEEPTKANYDKSRRVYNHLWQCNNGEFVNADVNDSYQIMRKQYPNLFKNGVDGYEKNPIVIDLQVSKGGIENGQENRIKTNC